MTDYADGFDEPGAEVEDGITASKTLYIPGEAPNVHAGDPI